VTEGENIHEVERDVRDRLRGALKPHFAVIDQVFNSVNRAFAAAPEIPFTQASPSRKVTTVLMVRLSNDLRSIVLLAERGYPLQAASLVPPLYEVVHGIAYIGQDDERAKLWINHTDPMHSFQSAWALTEEVVKTLDGVSDPSGLIARAYKVYQRFCQAKHANPLLQQHYGHYATDEAVMVMNGPDGSDGAIALTKETLKWASKLALIGIASFLDNHAPEGKTHLQPATDAIRSALGSL